MKMNRIDGSKISPTAIIAYVSAKHKICEQTASEDKEDFAQNKQTDDLFELSESFEETGKTEEAEEIERTEEIGETKETEKSNSYIHPAESIKTNRIDCSKKSLNSILASIYSKNSQYSLDKIMDEEKSANKKKEDSNNCEDITQTLEANEPSEPVNPYLQVVLLSSDEEGESGMENSNTRSDQWNDDSASENEPKIIEIPSEVITSFLDKLSTNEAGISLDSLIKITKAPKAQDDNSEDKRADE